IARGYNPLLMTIGSLRRRVRRLDGTFNGSVNGASLVYPTHQCQGVVYDIGENGVRSHLETEVSGKTLRNGYKSDTPAQP
ncbi:hypothetical protein KKA08_08840, partial [bacterium]|nr:hypothetical protein [bacterium]